jgi:hypothetical protein
VVPSGAASAAVAGLSLLVVLLGVPDAATAEERSAKELNKDVADPVSTTWSLKLKNKLLFRDFAGQGEPVQYELKFQPTMPVVLTSDLKLITRPELTLVDDKPYTNQQGELRRTTGFGDTILDVVLSPRSDPWLLGLGPTFVFPTANLEQTGQGKWQAGPAGLVGYRAEQWLAGIIAQQWWSFAGSESRSSVSELHLQYIADYFFSHGWSIGTSPTIEVDWRADAGDQVTFPFGPSIAKVVKIGDALPVKFELDGWYVPVHPSDGEQFVIQLTVTPVIPGLWNHR